MEKEVRLSERMKCVLKVLRELDHPETSNGIMRKLPTEHRDFKATAIYRDCMYLHKNKLLKKWGGRSRRKRTVFGLLHHKLDDVNKIPSMVNAAFNQEASFIPIDMTKRRKINQTRFIDSDD